MNFILKEDDRFPIGSFLQQVRNEYPNTCILSVTSRNIRQVLDIIKVRPLLKSEWCLLISPKLEPKNILSLMTADNLCIVHFTNSEGVDELQDFLSENRTDFRLIDNLKIKDEIVIEYVMKELRLSKTDAKYLCNRHKFHIPTVVTSVNILSSLDIVTRKDIQMYTRRFADVSIYSIVSCILGLDVKVSKNKIIELISDYQNGIGFILKTIKQELEKYLCVYKYIRSGLLDATNYLDFDADSNDKIFKTISKPQLKHIILAYRVLSFEKLYYTHLRVSRIKENKYSIHLLINLIGG